MSPSSAPPEPGAPPADRVLVVDADPDAAWSLAVLLEQAEFAVHTAADWPSALSAAADFRPQAVVAALPPPAGGLAALPEHEQPLLVALADADGLSRPGVSAVLPRPVDLETLTALLRKACTLQRRSEELRRKAANVIARAEELAGGLERRRGGER